MNLRIVRAILVKDLRSLLPMVLLAAASFAADVAILRWELVPDWDEYRQGLLILVGAVLTLAVFQLDSPVSLVDDWQCRPVPRRELLAAKLGFLFVVLYLPAAIATIATDLVLGSSFAESVADGLLLREAYYTLIVPVVLVTAVVTRTLVQGIGVLIALFIATFVIPSPFVSAPGPMNTHIGDALLWSGMHWLAMTPARVLPLLLAALGLRLAYWKRSLTAARATLGAMTALLLLAALAPSWFVPWPMLFATQRALEGTTTPAIAAPIYLRSTRACFPATRVSQLGVDAAFSAAREASGVPLWSDEDLRVAGSASVAFLTSFDIRRLPDEWRFMTNHVQADFVTSDSKPIVSLRPANYHVGNAHAWVLPESALRQLERQKDVALKLEYSLTFLAPRRYSLPTDGRRHALPALGWCRAKLLTSGEAIEVECFTAFRHPAQISASLNDVPATNAFSHFDMSPAWTQWLSSRRVTMRVPSARLAAHDSITVTAWRIAGYGHETLQSAGLLGADPATCPLPLPGTNVFQQSSWRDPAPHESSSISVQDGVQLEVLDFGGEGSPILLLPGLGATAHSFDELAPRLAQRHRVVAMTRRGAGYSSRPDFGFDTPRLAQDVLQIMDALHLDKVLLVGHSIAGDELTWLGGHHAERFRGLVYLDAAYDRSPEAREAARRPDLYRKLPPEPPIPPAAFRDYQALSKLLAQRGHLPVPEGELIAFRQADKPWLNGMPNIDTRAQQAITAALLAPDYERVKLPALAVYAIEHPDAPLPPWYDPDDAELLATVAEIARLRDTARRANIERFRRDMKRGQVLELPHAQHYVIQSNPEEVLDAIEKFAATLD